MSGLGHIELGNSARPPLVFFHGYPAAAQQVMAVPDIAVFDRFRIISVDRPGFGESTPAADRAELIARFAQLLAMLTIGKFHIVAVSAGAATAFVLADRLRERVLSLTSISSLGPLCERELFDVLPAMVRRLFTLARHSPWLLAKIFEWRLKARAGEQENFRTGYLAALLSPRDRAALRDPRIQQALRVTTQHAFRQGALAVAQEARRMQQHWPIDDWQFPFPVRLFHGDADHLVPPVHAEWLARHIAGSRLFVVPGEGHYSLPMFRLAEILARIC
jgi:pimeloyl-ACP methyl ester carboxylesterase